MKKLLSLLLALAMVFTLAACGGKSDSKKKDKEEEEDGIAGKYMLVSVEVDGEEMDEEDMLDEYGEGSYIEIDEDGTAVMKIDGEKMDMEWEDDEIWPEDDEDEKFALDINEKKGIVTITIEENAEITMIFEKESDDKKDDDEDDDKKKDDDEEEEDDKKNDEDDKYGHAVERLPEETAADTYPKYEEDDYDYPETAAPSYYEEEEDAPQIGDIYYFYSMTMDGQEYTLADLEAELGDAAKSYITLEITGNGKAIMTSNGESQEMEFGDGLIWPTSDPSDTAGMGVAGDFFAISTTGYTLSLKK